MRPQSARRLFTVDMKPALSCTAAPTVPWWYTHRPMTNAAINVSIACSPKSAKNWKTPAKRSTPILVIVNSIFLKKPHRTEVLGLVLLIALLIWRLMEKCMRKYIETTGNQVTGWKKKPTKRPTSFMMTTKFLSILVARLGDRRQLARPLKPDQKEFLQALNVSSDIFISP